MRGVLFLHIPNQKGALLGIRTFNVRLGRPVAGHRRFDQGTAVAAGAAGNSQTPDSTLEGTWKNGFYESH